MEIGLPDSVQSSTATPTDPAQHRLTSWLAVRWKETSLGWCLVSCSVFILVTGVLRLAGANPPRSVGSGLFAVVVLAGFSSATGGVQKSRRYALRRGLGWVRWLLNPHTAAQRRAVLFAIGVCGMASFLWWVWAAPSARLWPAVCVAVWIMWCFLYVGYKCCPCDDQTCCVCSKGTTCVHLEHRRCNRRRWSRKTCAVVSAFIAGVMGNYTASATVGDGSDARAIESSMRTVIGLSERSVALGEENKATLTAIVKGMITDEKMSAMLQEHKAAMDEIRKEYQAALERIVMWQTENGATVDEAVAFAGSMRATQVVEALDRRLAKGNELALQLHRERAAACLVAGQIDKAESSLKFIQSNAPADLYVANTYGTIQLMRGRLSDAFRQYKLVNQLATDDFWRAISLGNLGAVEQMYAAGTGEFEEISGHLQNAEDYHNQSLNLYEAVGDQAGAARCYNNLGSVEKRWGEILRDDSDLVESHLTAGERYHVKSLAIAQRLGLRDVVADNHTNLAMIFKTRGLLDKAEEYLNLALKDESALGRVEGMANVYANLGRVAQLRGNGDEAARMWTTARELYMKMGANGKVQLMDKFLSERK